MWQSISQQLGEWLQRPYPLDEQQSLGGSDRHQCFRVSDGRQPLFLKLDRPERLEQLEAQANGLRHLARSGYVITPTVVGVTQVGGHSLLALEWLDLKRNGDDQGWQRFGRKLASQHLASVQEMYGFDEDNFLGNSLQPNRWQRHWHSFFAEQRLGWQLELAAEKGLRFGDIDDLVALAAERLRHHHPKPALLHGDLWSGNLAFVGAQAAAFDPAIYYGDRECDLAMSQLFGSLPDAFYQGYEAAAPLPVDAAERRELYQLPYLLHHAHSYGGQHVADCRQLINRLLAF